MKAKTVIENTGHLCSIYCPDCGKVTNKISFNLLREAGVVEVICPGCLRVTVLQYDGKKATLWQRNEAWEAMERDMMKQAKNGNVKNGVITRKDD